MASLECFVRRTRQGMESGEMGWAGFYHYVREGLLDLLLETFSFFKNLKVKAYLSGEKAIQLKAIDFVQETCSDLRHVLIAFIKLGGDSTTHPHV